jgi:protein tyrosine/serine phosphatase
MMKVARQVALKGLQASLLALFFLASVIVTANAQAKSASQFSDIKIKNFGQMDKRFYRGAQPKAEDFKGLAALGIKTIIDLRDTPADYEKAAVEAAGMRYVNIPMSDSELPKPGQIEMFLKLASDSATGPFFVHCIGGRHRTGIAGAVYRMTFDGWDYDRAYKEMKDFDFYTRFGHGAMKDFVQDYWQQIKTGVIQVSTGTASSIQTP